MYIFATEKCESFRSSILRPYNCSLNPFQAGRNGVVAYATGLAFNSAGGAPLILSTCHMAYNDLTLAVAFGAGHGPVLEAEVMATTRLELSTEVGRGGGGSKGGELDLVWQPGGS